jgi:hypothetical protein
VLIITDAARRDQIRPEERERLIVILLDWIVMRVNK